MVKPIEIRATTELSRSDVVQFANHLAVQGDGLMFFLHFGQALPPLMTAEELQSAKNLVVKVTPVASIAIPKEKLASVVAALSEHLEAYVESGEDEVTK